MERLEVLHQGDKAGNARAGDVETDFGAMAQQLAEFYGDQMLQGTNVRDLATVRRVLHAAAYEEQQILKEGEASSGARAKDADDSAEDDSFELPASSRFDHLARRCGEWPEAVNPVFVPKASGLRAMMVSTRTMTRHG